MKAKLIAALVASLLVVGVAGLMATHRAGAAEEEIKGSVLIETQPAKLGSIVDEVTAYGTAVPAINGGMTLSVPAEGRVMHIAVTSGEAVHTGQSLLEFHLSAASSSTYTQAVTALKTAQGEQARIARLLGQQLATREQKALADKAVADAQATLAALEHETGGKPQQVLTAPFDGVVAAIPVNQGDRVAAGAALVTLVRSHGLVVTCGIEPAQVKRLKIGQSVRITPLSGDAQAVEGKLSRVDKSLNPKTRLVDADVSVDEELIQGQAFRAQIDVGELKGWIVPRDAVLDDDEGAYVFQVNGDKAKRVKVKRVGNDDENAAVDGPLDAKLEVVVVGNYQLEDGGAVRKQDEVAKDDATAMPAKKADGKQP